MMDQKARKETMIITNTLSLFIKTAIHHWRLAGGGLSGTKVMGKSPSLMRRQATGFITLPMMSDTNRSMLPKKTGMISNRQCCCYHHHHPIRFLDEQNVHQKDLLATSRYGLDPFTNTYHHPMVYHENYSFQDWPQNHSFSMDKFQKLAQYLVSTIPCTSSSSFDSQQPNRPLVARYEDFFRPLDVWDIPQSWFMEPTGPIETTYLQRFLTATLTEKERRYIGFREQTSRPELIERTLLEVAGTILASQLANQFMISTNTAGGTHHAGPNEGAGYTILNDLAITTHFLTNEELNGGSVKGIERVLVVDCDVHQGDGTAKFTNILQGKLFTLSLHCSSNYPRLKAQSTYDVGLSDNMKDDEYMEILEYSLDKAIHEVDPHFILYDAGVDVYEHDSLGRLKITEDGIRKRDRHVLETCVRLGIPVTGVIGGGYDKDIHALARRHAIVHEEAAALWRKYQLWIQ